MNRQILVVEEIQTRPQKRVEMYHIAFGENLNKIN